MYTKVFYDKCSNSLASRCISKYIFRTCTVLSTHRFDSTAIRTVNREKIRKDWIYFWSEGELESNYSGVDLLTGGSLKFSVGPAIIFALLPALSFSSLLGWNRWKICSSILSRLSWASSRRWWFRFWKVPNPRDPCLLAQPRYCCSVCKTMRLALLENRSHAFKTHNPGWEDLLEDSATACIRSSLIFVSSQPLQPRYPRFSRVPDDDVFIPICS